MSEILEAIAKNFPNLLLLIGFVATLYVIFQQYSKLQKEIDSKISNSVSARIGEILGSLQVEIARAETFAKAQEAKFAEISKTHDTLTLDILEKHEALKEQFTVVEYRFAELLSSLPDVEDYSADELLFSARRAQGAQSAQYSKKILEHNDASSRILELAGDLMREASRYSLARDLYKKAHETDPDRGTAYIEYICLNSELDPTQRNVFLNSAINYALESPKLDTFIRVVNAIIRLQRYDDLLSFCERFLEATKGRGRLFESAALRNMATAYKNLGRPEDAEEFYRRAYDLSPNDENSIRFYANSLEESGRWDDEIELRKVLIIKDPLDFSYYTDLLKSLLRSQRFDDTRIWIEAARRLSLSNTEKLSLDELEHRVSTTLEVSKLASK